MTKKYDVNVINVVDGWGHSSMEYMDCGKMSAKQMKDYVKEIAAKKIIPQSSCVHHICALCNVRDSISTILWHDQNTLKPQKFNSGALDIHITMVNHRNCTRQDCFNNIKNGKCTDEFVIDIIGKKFFADRYPNANTKQR